MTDARADKRQLGRPQEELHLVQLLQANAGKSRSVALQLRVESAVRTATALACVLGTHGATGSPYAPMSNSNPLP